MKKHQYSKPKKIDLRNIKANPTAEYQNEGFANREGWIFRLQLRSNDDNYVLPLFVHVYNNKNKIEAKIESDQTDYSNGNNVKRACLKNLCFWGKDE